MLYEKEALRYHNEPRPGKIEVVPTKPCLCQSDLSLAYTPGVAVPCSKIEENPDLAFEYTSKGNLVGVITNGSAVLGLGNIGPLASKPVMEGKGVLFKRFADIDVFDIEINTSDPDEFIRTVKLLEPTFGGINLEDIKAPECFYIEEELTRQMSIPVFHDDQHGSAIISCAALLNACELTGRKMESLKMVINGAGAAAIASVKMYMQLGVKQENIIMLDSKGVIYKGRTEGMTPYKEPFAVDTKMRIIDDAARGADVLIGYYEARAVRPDAIVATGRSDCPNQVNNVLGFPYIFRGALDIRATAINNEMKVAAVRALAELARDDVPDTVIRAYGGDPVYFGQEYIIPKPLDVRVLLKVAPAVAKAAEESGVARVALPGRASYLQFLEARLGPEREVMRKIIIRAQQGPKRIVLPEGNNPVILRAAYMAFNEGIACPLLLGNEREIRFLASELNISLEGIEILDTKNGPYFEEFSRKLFEKRGRRGWTIAEIHRQLGNRYIYGAMMVNEGLVDGQVHGIGRYYPDAIRPVLQVIPRRPGVSRVSGVYLMILKDKILLFADATVNVHPNSEELAEIAILSAEMAEFFDMKPRIAMLSFSNFGSVPHAEGRRVKAAVQIAQERNPSLVIDGEMQADTAVVEEILTKEYPFNKLGGPANVLIFPDLASGNIACKLLERLGNAKAVGPLLMGINKPFNVLRRETDMENVVNVIAITVVQAQELAKEHIS